MLAELSTLNTSTAKMETDTSTRIDFNTLVLELLLFYTDHNSLT